MQYIAQVTPMGIQVKEYDGVASWPKFKVYDHEPTDEELEQLADQPVAYVNSKGETVRYEDQRAA